MFALESQNWCRHYQNVCKTRQLKVALILVCCCVSQSWVRYPSCSLWGHVQLVQVSQSISVYLTHAEGCPGPSCYMSYLDASCEGAWVVKRICRECLRASCPSKPVSQRHCCLTCSLLQNFTFSYSEFWGTVSSGFVCNVTEQVCMGSNLWSP